jgi:transposase-like protein
LSVAEFCRREDVSDASFYAWRRRLSERVEGRRESPLFVPVELAGAEKPIDGVQIELPGGAVVTLPAEASAELVTTAIRAAAGAIEEAPSC